VVDVSAARLRGRHGDWDYVHQPDVANVLNVYPESIPDWMDGWLDAQAGYLAGNQGPGRVDFRFFSQGNLFAFTDTAAGLEPQPGCNPHRE
jgi:hypothetical protein